MVKKASTEKEHKDENKKDKFEEILELLTKYEEGCPPRKAIDFDA
ncbi:MAG: hypothetical protein QW559_02800 [Candidatus Woesearchaeota archaeon]